MAKGFTGSSSMRNCSGTSAGGGQSTVTSLDTGQGSSGDDGSLDTKYVFTSIAQYPTRADMMHCLFTWHSKESTVFGSLESVTFYLTTTNPSKITPNSNWEIGDSNPFSDSMNTVYSCDVTSSAGDGDLCEMWVDPGYYAMFVVQYYASESANYDYYVTWCYTTSKSSSNIDGSAPSLSYDSDSNKFTIGTSMKGRRILEFYNTGHDFGYPTSISDEETLNEMYNVSMVDMEWDNPYYGYYTINGNTLERWIPGSYTVGVQFNSSTNQSTISSAINSALTKINNVMNDFGVYFTRSGTEGDITIIVDSEENLFDIDPSTADYIYGGTWENTVSSKGGVVGGNICLANDYYEYVPYNPYATVAFEELTQLMGAGYDQVEYPFNTIHTEFNYYNKSASFSTKDKNILKLVYSDYVAHGDNYTTVALALNLPKGAYRTSSDTTDTTQTVSASFLKTGQHYKVRAFIVNSDGEVSETSDWIDVYTGTTLSPWSWTSSNGDATAAQTKAAYNAVYNGGKKSGGSVSDFSYLVWNDMCAKVQEIFDYAGNGSWSSTYATYNNTRMTSSSKTLTAKRFNSLRFNIGSYVSTGISEVSSGDVVKGEYFLTLAECLNEWISTVKS